MSLPELEQFTKLASPVNVIKGWLQPEQRLPLFRSLMETGPNTIVLRQYGNNAKRQNLVFYEGDPDAAYRYVQEASPEQDPEKVARPIPFAEGPPELRKVRSRLQAEYKYPFSLVYINVYADETVGIRWHNDAEEMGSTIPVKMLCLGGTRLFSIWQVRKHANGKLLLSEPLRDAKGEPLLDKKGKPQKKSLIFAEWEVPTESGDLVEMPVGFHEVDAYRHAVLPQKQYAAARISLTFRSPDLSSSGPWAPKPSNAINPDGTPQVTPSQPASQPPKVWCCKAGNTYPENAVYVGCKTAKARGNREGSVFGNAIDPFKVRSKKNPWAAGQGIDDPKEKEKAFREYAEKKMKEDAGFREQAEGLRGKDLLCWCEQDGPNKEPFCHARVWLKLANRKAPQKMAYGKGPQPAIEPKHPLTDEQLVQISGGTQ
jgi:alkylated DNA repair dioxygenase AlkB